jgi:ABC-2 type transport system permease protein
MIPRRSIAIARQDWRILRRDPFPVIVPVVLPLLLIPFVKPAFRLSFVAEHIRHTAGAEQAVPAMDVTFAFFLVGNSSLGFFREHAWRTWDRLRASPASNYEIVLGKIAVPLLQAMGQFALLFGLGALCLGLNVRGSWGSLVAVGTAYSLYLVAMGLAVIAACKTYMQANAITNVGALFIAGLGGALVPHAFLPSWARTLSPAVPSYWTMSGYREAILGYGKPLVSVAVLLAFATACLVFAALRLRLDDTKIAWA